MSAPLDQLLQHPSIWRVGDVPATVRGGISTGYGPLDAAFPEAGWPIGALSEILAHEGIGEFSLLVPALRAGCAEGKQVVLVGAPYVVYARALEAAGLRLQRVLIVNAEGVDALWATEQALRTGACAIVVLWATRGRSLQYRALQRLHGAASHGGAVCVLYRGIDTRTEPSPAPLRVACLSHRGRLAVELVKCRGVLNTQPIVLAPFPPHWSQRTAQPIGSMRLITSAISTSA